MCILNAIVRNFSKENSECLSTLTILIEFIEVSIANGDVLESMSSTTRNIKLSICELKELIGWCNKDHQKGEKHPLYQLEELLKVS